MQTGMTRLLETDEVPPVIEENGIGRSPFLLTCDHYGRMIPRALGDLGVSASELERHIAWDIGIAGVTTELSKLMDAHMIAQRYSRLVIDCNRPFESVTSIPEISEATRILGNADLDADAIEARRSEIFKPYHDRIAQVIDTRARQARPTVLIAMHSFTPVYAGIARPWHIGTLYSTDARLAHLVRDHLRAEGDMVVGDNEPYAASDSSDYAIPVYGVKGGLVHTGIEIRQDLIRDPSGQNEWAERLARIFSDVEIELRRERLIAD